VLSHIRFEGEDTAGAAEMLEKVVHSVSRAKNRPTSEEPIRNLEAYLFWAFMRHFHAHLRQRRRTVYVETANDVEALSGRRDENYATVLENQIALKEVLSYMNEKSRRMLVLRLAGYSWREVGERFDINAEAARVLFARHLRKAIRLLHTSNKGEQRGERI